MGSTKSICHVVSQYLLSFLETFLFGIAKLPQYLTMTVMNITDLLNFSAILCCFFPTI